MRDAPERERAAPVYVPPNQPMVGQIFDSLLVLVLVIATLFAPIYFGLTGGGKIEQTFTKTTWEGMGQNAAMQAQWEKLGFTPETAAPVIASRFDYSFSWLWLIATGAVVIGYFLFVVYYSDKEYRDVIAERFGPK